MITAKAWPLVPSDRPGEFRPSCWAWAREALQQAFSPSIQAFAQRLLLLRRAWTFGKLDLAIMERNHDGHTR